MPKDPRFNLWFRDHAEINLIELHACKAGMSAPQWIRHLVRQKLMGADADARIDPEIKRSILISRALQEQGRPQQEIDQATRRANVFLGVLPTAGPIFP